MEEKTVVIHQPDFMPYLGFFDRLLKADIYVIFDNVQYTRRAWMNRDRIKMKKGEGWLTVSTQKAPQDTPINRILLAEGSWREDNLNLLRTNYRNSPFFHEIMPSIEELYKFPGTRMMDFNLASIQMLMQFFDIQIETVLASSLEPQGKNNTMIIDIMKKLGYSRYLSGVGARNYFVPELYEQAGIEVIWQDFKHPVYPQQYDGFIPYLSSIDLLFNCGIKHSRLILRECT